MKPDPGSIPALQLNQAAIETGRGRTGEARRIYEQTIASDAVNPGVLWQAHAGLARLALASGDWERASQSFEAGIRIVEQSRSELNGPDNKITFLSRLMLFYQDYVDALMDRNLPVRALEVADSSRAHMLAQGLPRKGKLEIGTPRRRGTQSTGPPLRKHLAVVLGCPATLLPVGRDPRGNPYVRAAAGIGDRRCRRTVSRLHRRLHAGPHANRERRGALVVHRVDRQGTEPASRRLPRRHRSRRTASSVEFRDLACVRTQAPLLAGGCSHCGRALVWNLHPPSGARSDAPPSRHSSLAIRILPAPSSPSSSMRAPKSLNFTSA